MIKKLIKKTIFYQIYKKKFPYSIKEYFVFYILYRKAFKNIIELPNKCIKKQLIVSLTTYPDRIKSAGIVITSIMQQSLVPDKIILTLAESQFPKKKLPGLIQKEIKNGLEIIWTEDLRSHKKYYDVMEKYPNDIIITVDDDTYYPKTFISDLYKSYKTFPNCISCCLAREIKIEKQKILPYEKWPYITKKEPPSLTAIPLGIGGVLYPPNSLNKEVFNKTNLKTFCPNADDLWLKLNELLNTPPTPVVVTSNFNGKEIPLTQMNALYLSNTLKNQNDIQLDLLLNHYNKDNKVILTLLHSTKSL